MKQNKEVIISGSTGFIGRHLTKSLIQNGYTVTSLNRSFFSRSVVAGESIKAELLDLGKYNRKPYALIHLAAESIPKSVTKIKKDININLTQIILNNFEPSRFIFASSALVYPFGGYKHTECSPTMPVTLYGESKLKCEKLILNKLGVRARVLRIFNTIGPGMNEKLFVPSLIRRIKESQMNNQNCINMDGEDGIRSFIDICDLVKAIMLTMIVDNVPSVMNICSTQSLSLNDFAMKVSKKIGYNNTFIFKPSHSLTTNSIIGTNDLSKLYLGDYNTTSIEESIEKVIGGYNIEL